VKSCILRSFETETLDNGIRHYDIRLVMEASYLTVLRLSCSSRHAACTKQTRGPHWPQSQPDKDNNASVILDTIPAWLL